MVPTNDYYTILTNTLSHELKNNIKKVSFHKGNVLSVIIIINAIYNLQKVHDSFIYIKWRSSWPSKIA